MTSETKVILYCPVFAFAETLNLFSVLERQTPRDFTGFLPKSTPRKLVEKNKYHSKPLDKVTTTNKERT